MIEPIGFVRGGRIGAGDDDWGDIQARIEIETRFPSDCVAGLDAFSHVEIVFQFHKVPESDVIPDSRHPRERTDWPKVGIFAQRGRMRPNRLGVTVARLERVDGLTLYVQGLDAIDGTPVFDIKPYMQGFAPRGAIREPAWAEELMRTYW